MSNCRRCHCHDDYTILWYGLFACLVFNGIVWFFQSGIWLWFSLSMSAILFLVWLDNWAKKHPSPKVRKARWWVEGIMLVLTLLGLAFVFLCQDTIAGWMA